jgi:hypothetical protein
VEVVDLTQFSDIVSQKIQTFYADRVATEKIFEGLAMSSSKLHQIVIEQVFVESCV